MFFPVIFSHLFPYCFCFCLLLWLLLGVQGQGTKRQSQRDGEKGRELFALASAGSAFQALGAAERDTKGGNRKGIPLTIRDFFAVVFGLHWFRVSLGSVSCP